MNHPIIQAEVEMFREREREAGRAVYDDQLSGIASALHRAVESAKGEHFCCKFQTIKPEDFCDHCLTSLSKLDTIINFKE